MCRESMARFCALGPGSVGIFVHVLAIISSSATQVKKAQQLSEEISSTSFLLETDAHAVVRNTRTASEDVIQDKVPMNPSQAKHEAMNRTIASGAKTIVFNSSETSGGELKRNSSSYNLSSSLAKRPSADTRHEGGERPAALSQWHEKLLLRINYFDRSNKVTMPSLVLIILVASMLLILYCWWQSASAAWDNTGISSQVRRWLESLPVTSEAAAVHALVEKSESPPVVRLQGRVAAMPHSVLKAPLSQSSCVLFSTSAAEVRLDNVAAPPLAFHDLNNDFEIEVSGVDEESTPLHVRVHGHDVALFDMAFGRHFEEAAFDEAPKHFRDFVRAHRSVGGSRDPAGSAVVEFQECSLVVGAHVTCVGELRRDWNGQLGLFPIDASASPSGQASQERGRAEPPPPAAVAAREGPPERSSSSGSDGSAAAPSSAQGAVLAATGGTASEGDMSSKGSAGNIVRLRKKDGGEKTGKSARGDRSHGWLLGLTSWEKADVSEARVERVMISDDPRLLSDSASVPLVKWCCLQR
eukprot:TRINITY_DN17767_c0_g1_i1.p1 TRINITY_DN17767_c0_g1~~TRINITY_DN17767_c0_g1_i1.p1  ORF type:complete len:526 (-),score=82.26 TRINITY_DN17767_c0_g1_i1:225-1802(-)